jgi:hypothetical protein
MCAISQTKFQYSSGQSVIVSLLTSSPMVLSLWSQDHINAKTSSYAIQFTWEFDIVHIYNS